MSIAAQVREMVAVGLHTTMGVTAMARLIRASPKAVYGALYRIKHLDERRALEREHKRADPGNRAYVSAYLRVLRAGHGKARAQAAGREAAALARTAARCT